MTQYENMNLVTIGSGDSLWFDSAKQLREPMMNLVHW